MEDLGDKMATTQEAATSTTLKTPTPKRSKNGKPAAVAKFGSPTIIFKHYRKLTTEDQADEWFGILPKPGQWENTISYNRQTRMVTLPVG